MGKLALSVPVAVVVSLVLVGIGSALASSGPWFGKLALGAALFIGIVWTGAAIRSQQHHR